MVAGRHADGDVAFRMAPSVARHDRPLRGAEQRNRLDRLRIEVEETLVVLAIVLEVIG